MTDLMPYPGHDAKLQVKDATPMRIGALEFGVMYGYWYSLLARGLTSEGHLMI